MESTIMAPSGLNPQTVTEVSDLGDSVADSDDYRSKKCPPDCRDAKEGERLRRKLEKCDYHSVLNSMRSLESGLRIPLCRLIPLPQVRLVQKVNVHCLEIQFEDSDGYEDAD